MESNRKRKLAKNTLFSLLYQISTIICGFILPRFILSAYGSEINGLVSSVTQFLGVVTLLDMGVGAVVQSSLYGPLAEKDNKKISEIYCSATKYFRTLAIILVGYVVVLVFIFPRLVNNAFSFTFTGVLIIAISLNLFGQYYFGAVSSLVLSADQKSYIQYAVQFVTLIANTIISVILIKLHFSIQMVKLVSSLIYLIRPLVLSYSINKNYQIDKKTKIENNPIEQKWNGVARHLSHYVLTGTDSIVLTVFSTLSNVSVYSVYNLIVNGVKSLLSSATSGLQSLMGDMIVRKEHDNLNDFFSYIEWMFHSLCTIIFGCTSILLVPFVKIYTSNVSDIEYAYPLFGFLITYANAAYCYRMPYDILIMSANKYKETQSNYFIAMIMNIVISVATVKIFGLIGVTIGTLIAMLYQLVWMAFYNYKVVLNKSIVCFFKQICVNLIIIIFSTIISISLPFNKVTVISWIVQGIGVFSIWVIVSILVNYLFYKEKSVRLFKKLKSIVVRKSNENE